MTDKELLELAATAAGISSDGLGGCYDLEREKIWNPLTDDGDALRLAVKLEFGVCIDIKRCISWVCNKRGENIAEVLHDDAVNYDPYAATRRAIVRTAAELGKG